MAIAKRKAISKRPSTNMAVALTEVSHDPLTQLVLTDGSIIHIAGLPFKVVGSAKIAGAAENVKAINILRGL